MAKTKTSKEPMTLEKFAAAIHGDYLAIRKEMATKDDLNDLQKATKDELFVLSQKMVTREEFRSLQSDVKMMTDAMVSKADLAALREELLREIKDGKHIDDLRDCLAVVERTLGIGPARRGT